MSCWKTGETRPVDSVCREYCSASDRHNRCKLLLLVNIVLNYPKRKSINWIWQLKDLGARSPPVNGFSYINYLSCCKFAREQQAYMHARWKSWSCRLEVGDTPFLRILFIRWHCRLLYRPTRLQMKIYWISQSESSVQLATFENVVAKFQVDTCACWNRQKKKQQRLPDAM